jgi:hypothetical protein
VTIDAYLGVDLPLHHHVAADHDLAQRLAVVRDLGTVVAALSSPEVMSSTPCRALTVARSAKARRSCSGRGSQIVMKGAVSVRP